MGKNNNWDKGLANVGVVGNVATKPLVKESGRIPEDELDMLMGGHPTPANQKKKKKKKPANTTKQPAKSSKGGAWNPCHKSHPMLPIEVNGKSYGIYGGSCHHPAHEDMDVFVGLDSGMNRTSRQFPWCAGEEFLFHITDMSVPTSVSEFKHLLDYLEESILAGKKVFVGCIGGHGRTGLVFSALVNQMMGIEDSTTYVKENYCKKAVESIKQVDWLNEHFKIKKVHATKGGSAYRGTSFGKTSSFGSQQSFWSNLNQGTGLLKKVSRNDGTPRINNYGFVKTKGNLHGDNV